MSNRRTAARRVHIADQADAALRDAAGLFTRMARGAKPPAIVSMAGPTGAWVHDVATDVLDRIDRNTVRYCRHVARGPRPLHAAAWQRDVVVCSDCIGHLRVRGAEDHRCDRCQQISHGINGLVHRSGVLLLHLGICAGCVLELDRPNARAVTR